MTDTDNTPDNGNGGKRGPGQPPFYKTPEALAEKIEAYFIDCEQTEQCTFVDKRSNVVTAQLPKQPTITGLALYLGFASVQSLDDNKERGEPYSGIITRAKVRCGEDLNQRALRGQCEASIARLNLSANHGMSEKQVMEHTGKGGTDLFPAISHEERLALAQVLAGKPLKVEAIDTEVEEIEGPDTTKESDGATS